MYYAIVSNHFWFGAQSFDKMVLDDFDALVFDVDMSQFYKMSVTKCKFTQHPKKNLHYQLHMDQYVKSLVEICKITLQTRAKNIPNNFFSCQTTLKKAKFLIPDFEKSQKRPKKLGTKRANLVTLTQTSRLGPSFMVTDLLCTVTSVKQQSEKFTAI